MKAKPLKKLEVDDESLAYIQGTGSYDGFTEVPKEDKPKKKTQIGFVRQKKKKKG